MTPQEEMVTRLANATTYTAAGGATFLGLTANEVAAFGGLLIAFSSMMANIGIRIYYKRKAMERFSELGSHCALEDECPVYEERRHLAKHVEILRRKSDIEAGEE